MQGLNELNRRERRAYLGGMAARSAMGGGRRVLVALLVLGGSLFPLPMASAGTRVASGEGGGEHVRMSLGETGALLEFHCAHGVVDEALVVDEGGRFEVNGRFVR